MAGIDKIYGTNEQYNEFFKWLSENQKQINGRWPTSFLYPKEGYDVENRPISNFPEAVDKWLLSNCPFDWVINRIKFQYNIED